MEPRRDRELVVRSVTRKFTSGAEVAPRLQHKCDEGSQVSVSKLLDSCSTRWQAIIDAEGTHTSADASNRLYQELFSMTEGFDISQIIHLCSALDIGPEVLDRIQIW
jgi:hypothetical protein